MISRDGAEEAQKFLIARVVTMLEDGYRQYGIFLSKCGVEK